MQKRKLGRSTDGDRFTIIIKDRNSKHHNKYIVDNAKNIEAAVQEVEDTVGFWADIVSIIRG